MTLAFVFPGQGSQSIGMGKELYQTFSIFRETIEEAEDTLSLKIWDIIQNGSLNELTKTENTQPCILTVSYATYRILHNQMDVNPLNRVRVLAGHSLGEYSALLIGEALSFHDALILVRKRGLLMSHADDKGAMAAIIGLSREELNLLIQNQDCVIANDNCPGQLVISGLKESVEKIIKEAKQKGAKLTKMLPVSGAFHSPWMKKAACELEAFLENIKINPLKRPYYPNIFSEPYMENEFLESNEKQIKGFLVRQMTEGVRFREAIIDMVRNGVKEIVEIGPSKVLQGLVKRTHEPLVTMSLNLPEDVENYIELTQKGINSI